MKTVRRTINKNIITILIVAAFTAVALGVLLMLISGNEERNQVPTAPSEASEAEEETGQKAEATTAVQTEPGVTQTAQILFDSRVQSIEDSVGVAGLLESMDLKKNVASYKVEIQVKKSPKSLAITLDKTVGEKDKQSFDENMKKYAEQILALITDVEEVQWIYTLQPEGKKQEETTVFLDIKGATELLKADVKKYGESAKRVQALLDQQKGF